MEDPKIEAVIAKVRKLLAMAEGNANEHEAAVAAAKAQEMLEAYNLDMATINKQTNTFTPRKDEKRGGGLYKWQRNLWFATATLNFCKYYYLKGNLNGGTYEHQIIGSHVNVVGTEVMGRYLEATIERLARQWVAENHPGRSIFIKPAIAYREGIAARLTDRLWQERYKHQQAEELKRAEERQRNARAGINTENALVLQDVINTEEDLNNDHVNKWAPGTSAKMRAEREARQAKIEADTAAMLAKQAEWDATHPEEAARRKAKEQRDYEAMSEKWRREDEKRRYRKPTAEELRRQMPAFREGWQEGENVSLNKQVDKKDTRRIG
jgi:hypothetical protein